MEFDQELMMERIMEVISEHDTDLIFDDEFNQYPFELTKLQDAGYLTNDMGFELKVEGGQKFIITVKEV